jgi:thioredoxin-like negative regulator of GroEL
MLEFADNIKNETYKPDKKSQPVPESQSGLVTELVGSNFYDFVSKNETDVAVLYYTPWCKYCNQTLFDLWD